MTYTLHEKLFRDLTVDELYAILKLRSDVFVVEQHSAYNDVDGADIPGIHLWLEDGDGIAAYARVLPAGVTFDTPAIGRVIAARRGEGLGTRIMEEAIRIAEEELGADRISLESQVQAMPFYARFGFVAVSDEYDDGGVMHRTMVRGVR